MNKKLTITFLILGWVLLAVFLISGNLVGKYSNHSSHSLIQPVTWADHLQLFNGAIQCALTSDELLERKEELRTIIVPEITRTVELENGVTMYFDDNDLLLSQVMEFIEKEKACCPFFKFDLSILPFQKGFALQISGAEGTKEFILDFLNS